MTLSTEEMRRYGDDGYLLRRGMFSEAEVTAMVGRIADYLEGRREYPEHWVQIEAAVAREETKVSRPADGYRKLSMIALVDPLFHQMVPTPAFAALLQGCVGANVCAWGSGVFLKQAGTGGRQPWHRDQHGYGGPAATAWTALMDATVENGCMQMAPGSHRLEPLPNAEEERRFQAGRAPWKPHVIEMKAGDTLIWDMRTLHASDPNRSGRSRWSLAVHCVTTDAVVAAAKAHPDWGPHEILVGRHDAPTARAVRCMHCDRDAFAAFRPLEHAYR